jgi:hypothetical protein
MSLSFMPLSAVIAVFTLPVMIVSLTTFALLFPVAGVEALAAAGVLGEVVSAVVVAVDEGGLVVVADVVPGVVVVDTVCRVPMRSHAAAESAAKTAAISKLDVFMLAPR